jgi:general secretion pathway protein E
MPASNGERVVLRLLDKQADRLRLENLGMNPEDLQRLREIVHKPHGVFLVTGPTGSGKTTTLYSSLAELSTKTINILTVEDPIEYNLPGIGQTQVNTKADMTFARGLRAILRQDPDVVMVGEIRDIETAEIAVQASLTGHLVMSTLHTNTAVGAVTRLVDMGVEPFLLSSSLVGMLRPIGQSSIFCSVLRLRSTRLAVVKPARTPAITAAPVSMNWLWLTKHSASLFTTESPSRN